MKSKLNRDVGNSWNVSHQSEPWKIHVLGKAPSMMRNYKAVNNEVSVLYVDFSTVRNGYDNDQLFKIIEPSLNDKWPDNTKKRSRLKR